VLGERAPKERAKENEIQIQVHAAGVNRADLYQSRGSYAPPPGASQVLGLEVAGEIVQVGPDAGKGSQGFNVGDRVMALLTGGGYAQHAVARSELVLKIPHGMSFVEAAALPEALFTVWLDLYMEAGLNAGETILIHGGSSGIGTLAIQIAKALGSKVYVTARNQEKCTVCKKLGADAAIEYPKEDFVQSILSVTQQQGVDVILDYVGADYFEKNISLLKKNGRMVLIDFITGSMGRIDLSRVITRNLHIIGSVLRPRAVEEKAKIADGIRKHLLPLLTEKKIAPVIHKVFKMSEVSRAHELMKSSTHIGKIVLVPDVLMNI